MRMMMMKSSVSPHFETRSRGFSTLTLRTKNHCSFLNMKIGSRVFSTLTLRTKNHCSFLNMKIGSSTLEFNSKKSLKLRTLCLANNQADDCHSDQSSDDDDFYKDDNGYSYTFSKEEDGPDAVRQKCLSDMSNKLYWPFNLLALTMLLKAMFAGKNKKQDVEDKEKGNQEEGEAGGCEEE